MKLLGITGGVGMGKSAVAELLRQKAVPVVDTDQLARQVVQPGQPALAEIAAAFGPEMIEAQGGLARECLAAVVFSNRRRRQRLEAILHPRIRAAWHDQVRQWSHEGKPLAAVVIPLLFETGAAGEFDWVVCVACSPRTQRRRLAERGWSPLQVRQRLRAQFPTEEKMRQAHFVLWTEGDLDSSRSQVERLLQATRSAS